MKYKNFTLRCLNCLAIVAALCHYNSIAHGCQQLARENDKIISQVQQYNETIEAAHNNALNNDTMDINDLLWADGSYYGSGTGYGGEIQVCVTIENGKLTDVTISSAPDEDPAYLKTAEKILEQILQEQSTDVDTVTGATFSSKGILEAVSEALGEAETK